MLKHQHKCILKNEGITLKKEHIKHEIEVPKPSMIRGQVYAIDKNYINKIISLERNSCPLSMELKIYKPLVLDYDNL